jgi:hypothetical protein
VATAPPAGVSMATPDPSADRSPLQTLDLLRAIWKPSDPRFLPLKETGLSGFSPLAARAVLTALLVHARGGATHPSHATLVAATGLGRSTVIRTLGHLEALGLIERTSRPPRSTLYVIVPLWDGPAAGRSQSGTVEPPSTVPELDGTGPERDGSVPERDGHSPGAGHELPLELPVELHTDDDDVGGRAREREVIPDVEQVVLDAQEEMRSVVTEWLDGQGLDKYQQAELRAAEPVIRGDDATAWHVAGVGDVPWPDRPRILRVALSAWLEKWPKYQVRSSVRYAASQQLDPLPARPSVMPKDQRRRRQRPMGTDAPGLHDRIPAAYDAVSE